VENTGLCGRWQKIGDSPTIMIDTAHNEGGIRYVAEQLLAQKCSVLRIVFGMVNDKDINAVLALMPKKAKYYFTNASISRALPAADLQKSAMQYDLKGDCYSTVNDAYKQACADASPDDFIYIGGSNFVVAEVM
jgi:dihydrofolate synthase / folylpolyglutamate synthase